MTSLKIKYSCESNLVPFLKECNKIKRIAFNLLKKDNNRNNVIRKIKSSYNINGDLVDVSILGMQVAEAYALVKSCEKRRQSKLIFGSLNEWKRFNKGLITKDQFNQIKNSKPALLTGSANELLGNRKVKLDIDNKQVIFKKSRNEHFNLKLTTSNSRWKLLEKLQAYFEFNSTPVTYKLGSDYISIIFDESILKEKDHKFIEGRIAALDLNPNFVGFVVRDFNSDSIIHRSVFDLQELNATHNKNKKDHEVVEIAKRISSLCQHYQVECVGLEKLTMTPKNHGKGSKLNRLLNNSWNRNRFSNNLKKRLNILGVRHQEINAAYSSTVGCLDFPNETDSVAAAMEISRRTYVFLNRFIKKRKEFLDVDIMYPIVDRGLIKERWNSILSDYNPRNIGYKGIHEYLKSKKKLNELRFLFKDYDFSSWSSFSLKSYKSLVRNYQITLSTRKA